MPVGMPTPEQLGAAIGAAGIVIAAGAAGVTKLYAAIKGDNKQVGDVGSMVGLIAGDVTRMRLETTAAAAVSTAAQGEILRRLDHHTERIGAIELGYRGLSLMFDKRGTQIAAMEAGFRDLAERNGKSAAMAAEAVRTAAENAAKVVADAAARAATKIEKTATVSVVKRRS